MHHEKQIIEVHHKFDQAVVCLLERMLVCFDRLDKVVQQGEKIMSAISDFSDKMKVHNDHVDVAIEGLQGDVKNLTDQIAALQASAGQITPADQALLDGIEARASSIHDKLDALDALTPPVAP